MRWTTYVSPSDGQPHPGLLSDGSVHGVRGAARLLDLLGDDGEQLARAGEQALADPLDVVAVADAQLLAPVPVPPSVRDFYAYETHVKTYREANGKEMDPDWYELPVFYFQNPAAIRPADAEIPMPPGCVQFDYELEFAAVIGRTGANLAPDHVYEVTAHAAGTLKVTMTPTEPTFNVQLVARKTCTDAATAPAAAARAHPGGLPQLRRGRRRPAALHPGRPAPRPPARRHPRPARRPRHRRLPLRAGRGAAAPPRGRGRRRDSPARRPACRDGGHGRRPARPGLPAADPRRLVPADERR